MSRENVETAQAIFERFNLEGALPEELFDTDVELSNIEESPLPGPYRGYEGLRKWRDDLFEVVETMRFEIVEVIDADAADAVIMAVRLRGQARHTRIDIDVQFTIAAWLRGGRIYRTVAYSDRAAALTAVGLQQ